MAVLGPEIKTCASETQQAFLRTIRSWSWAFEGWGWWKMFPLSHWKNGGFPVETHGGCCDTCEDHHFHILGPSSHGVTPIAGWPWISQRQMDENGRVTPMSGNLHCSMTFFFCEIFAVRTGISSERRRSGSWATHSWHNMLYIIYTVYIYIYIHNIIYICLHI